MPRRTTWVALKLFLTCVVLTSRAADGTSPTTEQPLAVETSPVGQSQETTLKFHLGQPPHTPSEPELCETAVKQPCTPLPSDDQIVLVSTRNYPNVPGRCIDFKSYQAYRCEANGTCCGETVSLLSPRVFAETWVFVHGNQIPPHVAIERGTRVYRQMRCRSRNCGPIRFIIYSWPSQREVCRIADTNTKVRRTNAESFYFGSFLSTISCQSPVSIVAYSFGARITCGGLHLLNGGSLDGYCLQDPQAPLCSIRIAMLAAAVESDGILPGGRYDRAMCSCDKLLLLNNSRDQALRFFWFIDKSRPRALGRAGLKNSPYGCSVIQYDWQKQIGKDHSIWNYFDRSIIVDRILQTFAR